MASRIVLLFVVGLLVGAIVGYSVGATVLVPQISQLEQQVVSFATRVQELERLLANVTTSSLGDQTVRVKFVAERIVTDLDFPVNIAFAPDGRLFVNERVTGRIRVVQNGRLLAQPFAEVEVVVAEETGLLGLALHPDFGQQPYVYVYYTYRDASGAIFNRVAWFQDVGGRGGNLQLVLDRIPAGTVHNGGILAFGPDGKLYVSTGDTSNRALAPDPKSLAGKILRLNPDGSVPADNPFPGSPVYSVGHRNIFGMAFHPVTGGLYITENGPTRDDEVNLVRAGGNYGWPVVVGRANDSRFIDPLVTYTPNIAPTGLAFYTGARLPPEYRHNLFLADWNTGRLHRLLLSADYERVTQEEIVLDLAEGLLDVDNGLDGYLYVTTATSILRVLPVLES